MGLCGPYGPHSKVPTLRKSSKAPRRKRRQIGSMLTARGGSKNAGKNAAPEWLGDSDRGKDAPNEPRGNRPSCTGEKAHTKPDADQF